MIANLFPLGVSHYIIGGIFVGLGTALIYYLTSYIAGASSILESFLSFFTSRIDKKFRTQRILFFIGLVFGALVYTLFVSKDMFLTTISPIRLFVGGILVGFGTRLGRGCTSGHGICGLASLSKSSLINVVSFLVVAIITAHVFMYLGVVQ